MCRALPTCGEPLSIGDEVERRKPDPGIAALLPRRK
jgi:hypothetical protein